MVIPKNEELIFGHFGSRIGGSVKLGLGRKKSNVVNPYNGAIVGTMDLAHEDDVNEAISIAHRTFHESMKKMPAYERANILYKTAELLEARKEQFAEILALEAGKPLRDGRMEVSRGVQVLRFSAEEAKRISGELVPMDAAVGGDNRIGMVRRYPLGVVAAISPFNFPLNLTLHKLGPAFAAGNTVVLKPAEKTPYSSFKLAELFDEAGLPEGALNVVLGKGSEIGSTLVTDARVRKVTFTGSVEVGMRIREMAGLKKVTLELGSNSPNIVFEDADIDQAANALVRGSFAFAGQVCISVQRIYVQHQVFQRFLDKFLLLVKNLKLGDPLQEDTDIGPMISEEEAIRAESWVREAVNQGAQVVTGGRRFGSMFEPTVLTSVNPDMKVVCREAFAPLVSVIPFKTEEEAAALANQSDYGLQAGIFTADINRALRMADRIESGSVWINESSTYRQDNYPYGGVKLSGIGREGVKYATEDMTEIKFVGIRIY